MILYLSSVNSNIESGYYNAVSSRVNSLKNRNINLYVLNFDRGSNKNIDWVDENISLNFLYNSKAFFRQLTELKIQYHLEKLIKEKTTTVIHAHWAYPIGYVAAKVAKKYGIKFILSVHGSDIHTHPLKSKYILSCTKKAFDLASDVLLVSHSLKEKALDILNATQEKLHVTYNGYNPDIIDYVRPNKCENISQEIKIGYVGNFNVIKGVDLLHEIITSISIKTGKDVILYAVGDGPLKSHVELQFSDTNSFFYGHLENRKVYEILNECNFVLMPSRAEGFGLVALECFVLNTPCLSFNINGLKDIYSFNNELMFNNIDDMSDWVVNYRDDYDCKSLLYIDKFSIERIVDNELGFYI